jgi:hypothetical protein
MIITSFVKTNDKIRDQLLKNSAYFTELMCANIGGLKIHPISTSKPFPILTSAKDANMLTTGIKDRDHFLSKINSHLFLASASNQRALHGKLMPVGTSNLRRTNNSKDLTGLQAQCQFLLQATLRRPLTIC